MLLARVEPQQLELRRDPDCLARTPSFVERSRSREKLPAETFFAFELPHDRRRNVMEKVLASRLLHAGDLVLISRMQNGSPPKPPPTPEEKQAARSTLRFAIMRARLVLTWNEIVQVLAECPMGDEPKPSTAGP